jgi:hypothetical protein
VRRAAVAARSSKALPLPAVATAFHEIRVTAGLRTRSAYAYTPSGPSARVYLDRPDLGGRGSGSPASS